MSAVKAPLGAPNNDQPRSGWLSGWVGMKQFWLVLVPMFHSVTIINHLTPLEYSTLLLHASTRATTQQPTERTNDRPSERRAYGNNKKNNKKRKELRFDVREAVPVSVSVSVQTAVVALSMWMCVVVVAVVVVVLRAAERAPPSEGKVDWVAPVSRVVQFLTGGRFPSDVVVAYPWNSCPPSSPFLFPFWHLFISLCAVRVPSFIVCCCCSLAERTTIRNQRRKTVSGAFRSVRFLLNNFNKLLDANWQGEIISHWSIDCGRQPPNKPPKTKTINGGRQVMAMAMDVISSSTSTSASSCDVYLSNRHKLFSGLDAAAQAVALKAAAAVANSNTNSNKDDDSSKSKS